MYRNNNFKANNGGGGEVVGHNFPTVDPMSTVL